MPHINYKEEINELVLALFILLNMETIVIIDTLIFQSFLKF